MLKKFRSFVFEEEIRRGGQAVVYKGRHVEPEYPVAIKVLFASHAANEEFVARFRQEADLASRIQHPGIINVIESGVEEGTFCIVMPYVDGTDLDDAMQRVHAKELRVPPGLALIIMDEVVDGLRAAHREGVIHRDIKPGNILLSTTGEVKIGDFGLARQENALTGSAKTIPGTVLGSVHYMSPEQWTSAKDVDHRTDIFSLGVMIYELLAGKKPFDAEDMWEIRQQTLSGAQTPIEEACPHIPRVLQSLVARMLQKDPADRLRSMHDVKGAIDQCIDKIGTSRLIRHRREELGRFVTNPVRYAHWSKGRSIEFHLQQSDLLAQDGEFTSAVVEARNALWLDPTAKRSVATLAEMEKLEQAAREKAEKERAEREKAEKEKAAREKAERGGASAVSAKTVVEGAAPPVGGPEGSDGVPGGMDGKTIIYKGEPGEAKQREKPKTGDEPKQPDKPKKTEEPKRPEKPKRPGTPEKPGTPKQPKEPVKPTNGSRLRRWFAWASAVIIVALVVTSAVLQVPNDWFGAAVDWVRPDPDPNGGTIAVQLESEPTGAAVFIRETGEREFRDSGSVTNCSINFQSGDWVIQFRKVGWHSETRAAHVGDTPFSLEVELQKGTDPDPVVQTGILRVESEPTGAAVFLRHPGELDFEDSGERTNCELSLIPGDWEVEFRLAGWQTATRTASVVAAVGAGVGAGAGDGAGDATGAATARATTVQVQLRAKPGRLRVESNPSGATVELRRRGQRDFRRLAGVTPMTIPDLVPGRWDLRLQKGECARKDVTADVKRDAMTPLHVDLTSVGTGHAELIVQPAADVYLDGELVQSHATQIKLELTACVDHDIQLRYEAIATEFRDVRVNPGETQNLGPIDFTRVGRLWIFCEPRLEADIFLDGRRTSFKTPYKLDVLAGPHEVHIERGGYVIEHVVITGDEGVIADIPVARDREEESFTVRVPANEEVMVGFRLRTR